jgi:tetratricopeptide (TPR) repeat protein
MDETATDADFLKGKQVAFTGRLASMTRKEAAKLVRDFGGRLVPQVNGTTSFLIVGHEGWPLRKDGRLSRKLQKAHLLQGRGHAVSVLSEEDLLARLGLEARRADVRRLHSAVDLSELLGVPGNRLRAWMNAGLIHPVESRHGIAYFDFRQVAGARTLCDLIKAGVSSERIRRSLDHLQRWTGIIDEPMSQLAILEKDGALLVRVGDALADPTGQLLLDFGEELAEQSVEFPAEGLSADQWFDLGCRHEDAGRLREAEGAYRQALLAGGPDAVCCFNLANVLYALDRKPEAAERLHQAVELEPQDAAAWYNLGKVLRSIKRFQEAKAAFEGAVQLGYPDAHYDLADLLDELGEHEEARRHWQAYLQQDQHSRWARYARSRLEKSS